MSIGGLSEYMTVAGYDGGRVKECIAKTASVFGCAESRVTTNIMKVIDFFDFETHRSEFDIMKQMFSGIELYLRTAVYISYKQYLRHQGGEKECAKIEDAIKTAPNKKKMVSTITNAVDLQALVSGWYLHFNPELIPKTEELLEKFVTCEDVLFNRLYRKYVDPDAPDMKLWIADCKRPAAE
jgi:hypothetical protein